MMSPFLLASSPPPHLLLQFLSYSIYIGMALTAITYILQRLKTVISLMNSAQMRIVLRIARKAFRFLMQQECRKKSRAYHLVQMVWLYLTSMALFCYGFFVMLSAPLAILREDTIPISSILLYFTVGTALWALAKWGQKMGDAERRMLRHFSQGADTTR